MEDALGAITSAVGDDPNGPQVAALEQTHAWLLMRSGRHEAARQAADRALDLTPAAVDARFTRAVVRIPTRPEDALDELAQLAGADPLSRPIALWLGEAHWRSGNVGRALAVWEGAAQGQSQDAAVQSRLARAEAQLGDSDRAIGRIEALVQPGWASVEDRLLLARLLARVKRKGSEAVRILDEGLATSGLTPLDRARLLCEKVIVSTSGQSARASAEELSRWLDEGLAAAPDLPELLYAAALVDEELGALDRVVESLEAALELAPERPEVALRLALHLKTDDPEGAQQAIATGLRETPHYVPLHLLKAALAAEAGDRGAAAAAVRRALDFDPERHGAQGLLSPWIDPPAAHYEVARLIQRHLRGVDNPTLTTAAAMAYSFAGDQKRAEALLGQALRADPNEVGARLVRAILALRRGKRAVALRDVRAAAVNDSQHAIVRLYQARLYEDSRQYELAERIYRDQLAVSPLNTAARLGLARALAGRGQVEPARQEARALVGSPGDQGALRLLFELDRGKRPGRR
ncbi:MAG: tetratricopeptide repeat protein [Deltaproteobacteria bacterium]|nr:tetratricopeptide repeat protein [Deltaproteobacteria bacterium]